MKKQIIAANLRGARRRSGLNQTELSFLVGQKGGTGISRIEGGERVPSVEMALAFEAIFRIPVRVLFEEIFVKVEAEVKSQANSLLASWSEEVLERRRPATETLNLITESL